jgi:hypothetical protein
MEHSKTLWSTCPFEAAPFQVLTLLLAVPLADNNGVLKCLRADVIHDLFTTPCTTLPQDLSKQPHFMFGDPPAWPAGGQQRFNHYLPGRRPFNNLLCLGQYFLLCLAEL